MELRVSSSPGHLTQLWKQSEHTHIHFAPCSVLPMTSAHLPIPTPFTDEEMEAQRNQTTGRSLAGSQVVNQTCLMQSLPSLPVVIRWQTSLFPKGFRTCFPKAAPNGQRCTTTFRPFLQEKSLLLGRTFQWKSNKGFEARGLEN